MNLQVDCPWKRSANNRLPNGPDGNAGNIPNEACRARPVRRTARTIASPRIWCGRRHDHDQQRANVCDIRNAANRPPVAAATASPPAARPKPLQIVFGNRTFEPSGKKNFREVRPDHRMVRGPRQNQQIKMQIVSKTNRKKGVAQTVMTSLDL